MRVADGRCRGLIISDGTVIVDGGGLQINGVIEGGSVAILSS